MKTTSRYREQKDPVGTSLIASAFPGQNEALLLSGAWVRDNDGGPFKRKEAC